MRADPLADACFLKKPATRGKKKETDHTKTTQVHRDEEQGVKMYVYEGAAIRLMVLLVETLRQGKTKRKGTRKAGSESQPKKDKGFQRVQDTDGRRSRRRQVECIMEGRQVHK